MAAWAQEVKLACSFEEGIERVIAELKQEGLGFITDVDMRAAFKAKLGIDRRPYRIFGVCHAPLAYRALEIDPNIGLFLPCNVVVREERPSDVVVSFPPVDVFAALIKNPEFDALTHQMGAKLHRVAGALQDSSNSTPPDSDLRPERQKTV